MIKKEIEDLLTKSVTEPFRKDKGAVIEVLKQLNISDNTLIAELYLNYQAPFEEKEEEPEILEITELIRPNVVFMTKRFREYYNVPKCFIALTDDYWGKVWFYHVENGGVYEILTERLENISEDILPRWKDFSSFLDWYFGIE